VVLFLELKPTTKAIFGAKCPSKEKNALFLNSLPLDCLLAVKVDSRIKGEHLPFSRIFLLHIFNSPKVRSLEAVLR